MPDKLMLSDITNVAHVAPPNGAAYLDAKWPIHEFMGIEIETENFRDSANVAAEIDEYWCTHIDASLRNGTEWVTNRPIAGKELTRALDAFFAKKRTYTMSPRTSVHVHVNMSEAGVTLEQFRSIFALVYVVEPSIFRIGDESRKWCTYCSPLTDMSEERLTTLLTSSNKAALAKALQGGVHQDKYYGLNVVSLRKHGTLEFRYFPCTQDRDALELWIKLAMELKRTGLEFGDPRDMLKLMKTPEQLVAFINAKFRSTGQVLLRYLDQEDAVQRAAMLLALFGAKPIAEEARNIVPDAPAFLRVKNKLAANKPAPKPKPADPFARAQQAVQAIAPNDAVIKAWEAMLENEARPAQKEAIKQILAALRVQA